MNCKYCPEGIQRRTRKTFICLNDPLISTCWGPLIVYIFFGARRLGWNLPVVKQKKRQTDPYGRNAKAEENKIKMECNSVQYFALQNKASSGARTINDNNCKNVTRVVWKSCSDRAFYVFFLEFTCMTTAGHALLPILSCQNVTKFETFDVYYSSASAGVNFFHFFCMLTLLYPKYVLRDFEKILSTGKKIINEFWRKFFFYKISDRFFNVDSEIGHEDERPYAKFKQNLPWNFKENRGHVLTPYLIAQWCYHGNTNLDIILILG